MRDFIHSLFPSMNTDTSYLYMNGHQRSYLFIKKKKNLKFLLYCTNIVQKYFNIYVNDRFFSTTHVWRNMTMTPKIKEKSIVDTSEGQDFLFTNLPKTEVQM